MLDLLNGGDFAGGGLAAVNTDAASLAASSATVKVQLETKLLRGLGTGGDPERGRAIAEEQFATLKTACEGADVVFVVAGLGGGAGSGISPVLARAARESGALVLAFVAIRVRGQSPPAAGPAGTRPAQIGSRRRHRPFVPEDFQVD